MRYGIIGFFVIDNAARGGGALAGMLVGGLATAPKKATDDTFRVWDSAGWMAAAVLVAGAIYTTARLVGLL